MTVSSEAVGSNLRARTLHEQFLTLSWLIFRRMLRRLQEHGITHPQFVALTALVKHKEPATMSQLTEVTFQDAPTTTGIVNRLVKMGLINRTRSEDDRRVVWVEATEAGEALISEVMHDFQRSTPTLFDILDENEITRAEEVLNYFLDIIIQEDQNVDLAMAKKWLQDFVCDPISFVKKQQSETKNKFL